MDQKETFRQMVDFNKKAFDNTFSALVMFQDQSEKMFMGMLEQATWLPADGKKAVAEWVKTYKKSREDFRKAVDDGFKRLEEFGSKPTAPEKAKAE